MGLPKSYISAILGKHPGSIYGELNRNRTGGVYTGKKAQEASVQRRPNNSPKSGDRTLAREIMSLFKKDLFPDRISGQSGNRRPDRQEKQVSTSTVYAMSRLRRYWSTHISQWLPGKFAGKPQIFFYDGRIRYNHIINYTAKPDRRQSAF
jgi:IS30 family transposase